MPVAWYPSSRFECAPAAVASAAAISGSAPRAAPADTGSSTLGVSGGVRECSASSGKNHCEFNCFASSKDSWNCLARSADPNFKANVSSFFSSPL